MPRNKDQAYVSHILEAIGKIESYLGGVDFEVFLQNDMLFDALIRELSVIGEAANRLSEDFRKEYPDIPFSKIIGMRNFLIHEYFGVEPKTVWDTCKERLPELKRQLLEER